MGKSGKVLVSSTERSFGSVGSRQRVRRSSTDVRLFFARHLLDEDSFLDRFLWGKSVPCQYRTAKLCSFWTLFVFQLWNLTAWIRYMKEVIRSLQVAPQNCSSVTVHFGMWSNLAQYDPKWVVWSIPKPSVYWMQNHLTLQWWAILIVRGREYTFAKGGNICQGLGSPLQNVHTLAILGFMEVAGMLLVNIRIDMNWWYSFNDTHAFHWNQFLCFYHVFPRWNCRVVPLWRRLL